MRIYAFQGITYDRQGDATPDERGRRAAPPYDQINDERAAALHQVDPHHFTWLTRPVPGESGDPYREASRLHGGWLQEGVVHQEEAPALYANAIELPDGSHRLGLTALVGLEPPESGVIRPHEETLAKPLADRLALLRAMEVDLEPVLLLSEDDGELDRLLAEDLDGSRPLASHRDDAGNRHEIHRVTGAERLRRYRECLAQAPAAIADGHHRYKVALRYAQEQGLLDEPATDLPPPAATKLAVITSVASPALEIRPIHRAFARDPGIGRAAAAAAGREPVKAGDGEAMARAVAAASEPERPALGVQLPGRPPEIWRLDPETPATAAVAPAARKLAVALLHSGLYPSMGLTEESATDGTTLYRSDPGELWRAVEGGKAAVGIYLPPMDPAQFAAAIAEGDMLPPKSTRFLPKLISGLVWADHRTRLA